MRTAYSLHKKKLVYKKKTFGLPFTLFRLHKNLVYTFRLHKNLVYTAVYTKNAPFTFVFAAPRRDKFNRPLFKKAATSPPVPATTMSLTARIADDGRADVVWEEDSGNATDKHRTFLDKHRHCTLEELDVLIANAVEAFDKEFHKRFHRGLKYVEIARGLRTRPAARPGPGPG